MSNSTFHSMATIHMLSGSCLGLRCPICVSTLSGEFITKPILVALREAYEVSLMKEGKVT